MRDLHTLIKMLYQIYYILNKKQRVQMIGMIFVILIGSLLELLGVSAMLPFIQSIMEPEELMNKKYISSLCNILKIYDPSSVIILVGVGIVLIYVAKNVYLTISAYLQAAYSSQTQKNLSTLMLRSFMDRPYSFFVDNGTGVIINGVHNDVGGVFNVLQNGFKLLSELLVVFLVTIYLITTDLILALGVLVVGFFCLLIVVVGLKKMISRMSALNRNANKRQYNWLVQISGGIKDILVYNRQKLFLGFYEEAAEDNCRASKAYSFTSAVPERIIEAFCVSGIIITVLARLKMGVSPEAFVPKMAVFAMGAFRLLPSISRSAGYINTFVYYREWVESAYENIVAAEKINEDRQELIKGEDRSKAVFQSALLLRNICWKYDDGKDFVLDGLTIDISKGESIGIVGESGSGKSTLADILLRLYRPLQGEILMDGTNIESIPKQWSRIIGYVPQTVFLVDDTIRSNVTFGLEESNDDNVWNALKKASLDTFVNELPDGLDTIVGERGVKLSGGQRQRIAIARALYANPQILILDEATSALDNETEDSVMEAIDALAGQITLIIIAHRVTTLKGCDKIYEIVNGKAIKRNKMDILNEPISAV